MVDGITRIAVEGFKSIANRQEIEIAPLTILAGANSSGKSSIMQPLLMLKQTLDATFDPGPLRIDGPNVQFSSTDQFFSRTEKSTYTPELNVEVANAVLVIEIRDSGGRKYAVRFRRGVSEIELEQESTVGDRVLTLRPYMSDEAIRSELCAPTHSDKLSILRDRFLLKVVTGGGAPITPQWVEPFLRNLIHVPGSRSNSSRVYGVASPGPSFPGTFEFYVASVIHHWQSHDLGRLEALNADLEQVGLARSVRAHKFNDASIDLRVPRLLEGALQDEVSVADVGLGVSHILPVLVALRTATQGQLVYIEQPEIHLHPRAQTKLADVLARAAKRGVRVVAETHSSLLLTAIQTLVAKGELPPDLVQLHWFQRDPKTGNTLVTSADLDENGAFGDWPEDFDAVALDAEGAYLDAVESHRVP